MTKAQLLAQLASLPDDANVLIDPWPETAVTADGYTCPIQGMGDLFAIEQVNVFEYDGPDGPAFATISPHIAYIS